MECIGICLLYTADDADDEMPDDDKDEDEPIGPCLADQLLDQHPEGTNVEVYCTGCHQNVKPTRFNICPECELTDSAHTRDSC